MAEAQLPTHAAAQVARHAFILELIASHDVWSADIAERMTHLAQWALIPAAIDEATVLPAITGWYAGLVDEGMATGDPEALARAELDRLLGRGGAAAAATDGEAS